MKSESSHTRAYVFLILILLSTIGTAQVKPRHLEKIAYDDQRGKIIVFGGVEIKQGGFSEPADVSEWDGKQWTVFNLQGPVGRRGHALIYSPTLKRVLVMGGVTNATNGDSVIFDTWGWNGRDWELVDTSCPFKSLEAVYDAANKRVLAYGDAYQKTVAWSGGMPRSFELWEFRSGTWRQLSSEGPVPGGPYTITFNTKKNSLVMLTWENEKLVVWEWRENAWRKEVSEKNFPPLRNRYGLTYAEVPDEIYLFGGRDENGNFLNDFWKYNWNQWTKIESNKSPGERAGHSLLSIRNKIVLYGGTLKNGTLSNELWQWDNQWVQIK